MVEQEYANLFSLNQFLYLEVKQSLLGLAGSKGNIKGKHISIKVFKIEHDVISTE